MSAKKYLIVLACICYTRIGWTEPPSVIVDIPPVHSLVANVMTGIGTPEQLTSATGSPHHHALRPSDARRLQKADLVIWIGAPLTPWLDRAIQSLTINAKSIALITSEGVELLSVRQDVDGLANPEPFKGNPADKDLRNLDPHIWLDPENAKAMLDVIVQSLSQIDNANAERYAQNALNTKLRLNELSEQIHLELQQTSNMRFIYFHDAYQYFERRFGIKPLGAFSESDAKAPGPATLRTIHQRIDALDVACVFVEPQFEPKLVDTIIEGTNSTSLLLDPLGASITPGPALYPTLLRNMSRALLDCRDRHN